MSLLVPPAVAPAPFRRILVHPCATASEATRTALVGRAVRLARCADARLTLVDVLPDIPGLVQRLLPAGVRVAELAREERQRRLDTLARGARRSGVPVDVLLLEGSPAVALVREVLRGGHDLLMLPAGGGGGAALGVTLVRKAPCPVWLHPARGEGRPRRRRPRILAAIDLPDPAEGASPPQSAEAAAVGALARRILDVAASLAEREGGELHVVHAWTAYGEETLRGRAFSGITAADVQHYVRDVEVHAAQALAAAVAPLRAMIAPGRVHLVKGEPGEVIPAVVRAHAADTLVMGTVARSGLAGLLIGNTAEQLVDGPPCAVLVVKPAGFVSPIAPGPAAESVGAAWPTGLTAPLAAMSA